MSAFVNTVGQNYILGQQATAFDNEVHSDCEVHVGNRRFKVAKFVLGLHSEVFRAAFYHNTIEKQNGVIKIDDLDPVMVEKMLRYMYTGVVDNLDSVASELYVVADRYAVHSLKDLCHLALFANLRIENILHCLELLYTFDNLKRFKPKTLQFVTNNLSKITCLPAWKDFCSERGDILREILEVIANNRPADEIPPKQARLDTMQYSSQPTMQKHQFSEISSIENMPDPEIQILEPQNQFPSIIHAFYPHNSYSQHPYQEQSNYNWPQSYLDRLNRGQTDQ